MGKTKCELCGGVARTFCESDQASLCWDCDGNVHGANFLVAKHTRCLLCSACQSPTPWKASGLRLGPTVSICVSCVARKNSSVAARESRDQTEIDGNGDRFKEDDGAESYDEEDEDEDEDEESDEDEEDKEEEEEAENQVVPWDEASQLLPVVSSSSSVSSGEEASSVLVGKRTRRDLDLNCSDTSSSSASRDFKIVKKSRDLSR